MANAKCSLIKKPMAALIQKTIGHLLPNPQILNFHEGLPVLPDWVAGNLSLMMGAGDLNHDGIPNIAKFNTYDVFLCEPWDLNGSLLENVELLLSSASHKLLCFLNIHNNAHVAAFTELFAGRFNFIDGHGGHCPHFTIADIQTLLTVGGKATNIYEQSETMLSYKDLLYFLEHNYFPRGISHDLITGRIYGHPEDSDIDTLLRAKIAKLMPSATQIQLSEALIHTMNTRELQNIIRILLYDNQMPVNLSGAYVTIQSDWQINPTTKFVITKLDLDYKTTKIASFTSPEAVTRAHKIITAIKADINMGDAYCSKAKYKTLCKFVEANA